MTKLSLPSSVSRTITRLQEAGYEAYAVGGCVRDLIMGISPHDYDLCTSAKPDEILSLFSGDRCIETGIKHGTVTVLTQDIPLEITTFRTEQAYTDGRHPDRVTFVNDIVADLSRRDFTMNAIAYVPDGGILDPFGGVEDIKKRILRCVGVPEDRFREDALRILRCLRFYSRFGYTIDNETAKAMHEVRGRLALISSERIASEFYGILRGDRAENALREYSDIFCQILPELTITLGFDQNNPHHVFDLYTHLCKTAAALPKDPVLRLAGLLHDIAKPVCETKDDRGISHYYKHAQESERIADGILRRLKVSNEDRKRITSIIHYHDGVIEESDKAVARRLHQLGEDRFFDLLALQRADNASQTNNPLLRKDHNDNLVAIARRLLAEGACTSTKALAVNGHDLLAEGLSGPDVGRTLSALLEAVMNGEIANEKDALIAQVRSTIQNGSLSVITQESQDTTADT